MSDDNAVASVLARAQEAVARARRLTQTYQHSISSISALNWTAPGGNGGAPAELADAGLSAASPRSSAQPSSRDPAEPAAVPSAVAARDMGAREAAQGDPCSADQQPAAAAAGKQHEQQQQGQDGAADSPAQPSAAAALASAAHNLAQLHSQQAATLRQLLDLRADQMRLRGAQLTALRSLLQSQAAHFQGTTLQVRGRAACKACCALPLRQPGG